MGLPEALASAAKIGVFDASVGVGNDATKVVGHDLDIRIAIEDAREDDASHRGGGVVEPPEDPPDVILRFILGGIVVKTRPSCGMEKYGEIDFGHLGEDRVERRIIQRTPLNVRVQLDAA